MRRLGTDSRGNYRADIGWEVKATGRVGQHTVYFGTDGTKAQIRYLQNRHCWDAVEKRWGRLPPTQRGERPLWTRLTVAIALAVTAGNEDFYLSPESYRQEIGAPHWGPQPPSLEWFGQIQQDFRMIRLRLVDEQAEMIGRQQQGYKKQAEQLSRLAGAAIVCSGQTLHQALDAFGEWYKAHHKTPEGKQTYDAYDVGERVKAIKRLVPNLSLQAFGLDEIDRPISTWKNRPLSNGGKPYSISACKNHLKITEGSSSGYIAQSRLPGGSRWTTNPKPLLSARPRMRKASWFARRKLLLTVDELATLWKLASPRARPCGQSARPER